MARFVEYQDPRALQPLIGALKDKERAVREEAARVLGYQDDARVALAPYRGRKGREGGGGGADASREAPSRLAGGG